MSESTGGLYIVKTTTAGWKNALVFRPEFLDHSFSCTTSNAVMGSVRPTITISPYLCQLSGDVEPSPALAFP